MENVQFFFSYKNENVGLGRDPSFGLIGQCLVIKTKQKAMDKIEIVLSNDI